MLQYNFFGKDCLIDQQLANREDLNQKLLELNFKCSEVLLLNQVHGKEVIIIDDASKIYGTQGLPKVDGIVTNLPNVAIGVVTADCGPILFYDNSSKIIGACHAGWKGAKNGIIEATIKAMKSLGSSEINAIIGPMIQQYSYQVSADFYDEFLLESINNKKYFKISNNNKSKWQFDLPSYITDKLYKNSVVNVDNLNIDTYTNMAKYNSYRRYCHLNEENHARNISVICMN
jgi:YfiH family protein